jgi:type I restriction-modification system DNA methylase subunit
MLKLEPGEILLDPACGTGGFLTGAINNMRKRYVKRLRTCELTSSIVPRETPFHR